MKVSLTILGFLLTLYISKANAIDDTFIASSVGKTVKFYEYQHSNGVPNCVAAALRGGGYLPAFALRGTDDFYNDDLPSCFEKLNAEQIPQKGDIGIVYANFVPTLAHAVLFIDSQQIFEKASPNEKDLFRISTWAKTQDAYPSEGIKFRYEVWRYANKSNCVFDSINNAFKKLDAQSVLKLAAEDIEKRIASQDWDSPSKPITRALLNSALEKNRQHELGLFKHLKTKSFSEIRHEFVMVFYEKDVLNLLINTPAYVR